MAKAASVLSGEAAAAEQQKKAKYNRKRKHPGDLAKQGIKVARPPKRKKNKKPEGQPGGKKKGKKVKKQKPADGSKPKKKQKTGTAGAP